MGREILNKIVVLLLLTLYLSYYGSNTFFSHYHKVGNTTVVHSHFFHGHGNSTGKANHTHTQQELRLIAWLTFSFLLIPTVSILLAGLMFIRKVHHLQSRTALPRKHIFTSYQLRAPPVFA